MNSHGHLIVHVCVWVGALLKKDDADAAEKTWFKVKNRLLIQYAFHIIHDYWDLWEFWAPSLIARLISLELESSELVKKQNGSAAQPRAAQLRAWSGPYHENTLQWAGWGSSTFFLPLLWTQTGCGNPHTARLPTIIRGTYRLDVSSLPLPARTQIVKAHRSFFPLLWSKYRKRTFICMCVLKGMKCSKILLIRIYPRA